MEMNRIGAGILAGGKHTRMGTDKLLLDYKGKSFLEHMYEECRIFPEIQVSVADKKQYADFPYCFVEDEKKEYGPLEGIYQLLFHSRMEYVFVLAADMPRISAEFLKAVADAHDGEDCFVITTEKDMHPLCTVYAKRVLPKLSEMRAEGIQRPRLLYRKCRTRYVSTLELGYPEDIVGNINTPEEYERLVKEHEID